MSSYDFSTSGSGSKYDFSSSGGGSKYDFDTGGGKKGKKSTSRHGVGGFAHNLADNAVGFVYGFVPGVVETVKHPVRAGENIAKNYAYTYGPAFRGDWRKFGQNLYDNPLGPILDVLTIASAGAGAGVRAGVIAGTAGKSIRLTTAGSKVVEKGISARPLRGYTQIGIDAALKAGTKQDWKVVGEYARAGKVENRLAGKAARANEQHANAFYRTIKRLGSDQEKVAVYLLATLPDPDDLARQTAHLEDIGSTAELALMKDPKMLAIYNNPSAYPKVQAALKSIEDLGKAKQRILGTTLSDTAAFNRLYLHTVLSRGGRFWSAADTKAAAASAREWAASAVKQANRDIRLARREFLAQKGLEMRSTAKAERLATTRSAAERVLLRPVDRQKLLDDINMGTDPNLDAAQESVIRGRLAREITKTEARVEKAQTALLDAQTNPKGVASSVILKRTQEVRKQEQALKDLRGQLDRAKREAEDVTTEQELYGQVIEQAQITRDWELAYAEIEQEAKRLAAEQTAAIARGASEEALGQIAAKQQHLGEIQAELDRMLEEAAAKTKTIQPAPGYDSLDQMIGDIRAGLAAKGRPEPLYLPDVMREKNVSIGSMNAGGTGLTRPIIKQNQGVLFMMNKLIMDPSVAGPAFLSAVKYAHHVDLYNRLLEGARVLPKGEALLEGYQFLRRPVRPVEAVIDGRRQIIGRTPEKIGYVQKELDGYEKWLDDLRSGKGKPDEEPPAGEPFTTASADNAAEAEGGYLIVPKRYAKAMAGEFTRSQGFFYWLNRKPMRVWRALVLNLRPAWLVNNIVGNTFMYLMYNASPDGVKNLAAAFKRMAPPAEAKQFDALMYRHFGNQLNATFIGTQRPSNLITKGVGASTKRRVAAGTERVLGSLADVDKAYESALRKAAVRTALKKNPALKAAVNNMRSETRDFYAAASKALDENPVLVQQIEDRVDAALGNFTSLGKFEKEALRSIFPFYAWFRAITEVAVKLPLEQPAKLALFSRLGQIGAEKSLSDLGVSADEVPGWARGLISLGPMAGSRMPALNTSNAMPFGTVVQMGSFAKALAAGHPGEVGQTLPGANPLAMALLTMLAGKNPQTGAPLPDTLGGGGVIPAVQSVYQGLPQYKLYQTARGTNYKGKPGKPTLYAHTLTDDLLRYLGVPKADVSPLALRRMQEKLSNQPR